MNMLKNTYADFSNEYVRCRVEYIDDCKRIKITGSVLTDNFASAMLIASNPIDNKSSYSATGLPFPCADIAFEGTKNIHKIQGNRIDTVFTYPNSYYSVADKKRIVSSIFFVFEGNQGQEFVRFQLKDFYPLRSLTNRETREGPEFYSSKHDILHIGTAEEVMREYAKIKTIYRIA